MTYIPQDNSRLDTDAEDELIQEGMASARMLGLAMVAAVFFVALVAVLAVFA